LFACERKIHLNHLTMWGRIAAFILKYRFGLLLFLAAVFVYAGFEATKV